MKLNTNNKLSAYVSRIPTSEGIKWLLIKNLIEVGRTMKYEYIKLSMAKIKLLIKQIIIKAVSFFLRAGIQKRNP